MTMTVAPEAEVRSAPSADHPTCSRDRLREQPHTDGPAPCPEGQEIAPGYTVVEHMRRGADYDTYDAWSTARYAHCFLKTMRPDRLDDTSALRALRREARLLLAFSHPHIVRAYELSSTPTDRTPVLVLETLTGPTLSDLVDGDGPGSRLPAESVGHLGRHLCSAVRYVHDHGHLHLDIKPSNIIAFEGHARLVDFSLARPPGPCHRGRGTAGYMSPEQALGAPLTAAADIWAVGLSLYVAATGHRPFETDHPTGSRSTGKLTRAERYPQLVRPVPRLRSRRRFPLPVSELIDACLRLDPTRRPTLRQLDEALTTLTG
jgi:serine/threonine protein kinase